MIIKTTVTLTPNEQTLLYDLANKYVTSKPVSGSWETETIHQLNAIKQLFNTNTTIAKCIMMQYLDYNYEDLV